MGRLALVAAIMTGCLHPDLVACEDGRVCAAGTLCDVVHATCVVPEQQAACSSKVDGDSCGAADLVGICDGGFCLPGCGDGNHGAGEECDDGNFRSHDGCSSSCVLESPSWVRWVSPWTGRAGHATAFHAATQKLVVFGGASDLAVLDDQWTRDASGQWERVEHAGPPARRFHAMVYDTDRQVIVMFGGIDGMQDYLADTWEYDGTAWQQVQTANAPSPRLGAALVYDMTRKRVVLFGGRVTTAAYDDTWEYNGTDWAPITTATTPPERAYASMAYDSTRQRVLMFGGGSFNMNGDTWEYNGLDWTLVATTGPSKRLSAAMAYFPMRSAVVLFGGRRATQESANDTWEYTPSSGWTQVVVGATTPPARTFATFTHDTAFVAKLVLVGGSDSATYDDVWEYAPDGTWVERTPRFAPTPRAAPVLSMGGAIRVVGGLSSGLANQVWKFDGATWQHEAFGMPMRFRHGCAYDSDRGRAVLFGGLGLDFVPHDDTFEWDAATLVWSQYAGSARPPKRENTRLVYDSRARASVLFGGYDNTTTYDDTWEYDATNWVPIATAEHPPAQADPVMTYDPLGERTILFDLQGQTWSYRERQWTRLELAGAPPGRSGAVLAFHPLRQRVVMFLGADAGGGLLSDGWELADTAWVPLQLTESPPGRIDAGIAALGSSFVLYGGHGATADLDDTWLFRFTSRTADESCSNAIDDDGDRQIDGSDPDCTP